MRPSQVSTLHRQPVLVIFCDALRFLDVRSGRVPLHGWDVAPVRPWLGYSVSLHRLMFDGMSPAMLGYFGDWAPADDWHLQEMPWWGGIAKTFRNLAPSVDSYAHAFLKRVGGMDCANIPFEMRAKYTRVTSVAESARRDAARFEDIGFIVQQAETIRGRPPERDRAVMKACSEAIAAGQSRVFVALCDLDSLGHKFGLESREYSSHLQVLHDWVCQAADAFVTRHSGGAVLLVSDHGMAAARGWVVPPPASRISRPNEPALVFYDDVTARVWSEHGRANEAAERLATLVGGTIVLPEERSLWGLDAPQLGHAYVVLDEGMAFRPSYFGIRRYKAYHGYLPTLPSQWGVSAMYGSRIRDIPFRPFDLLGWHSLLTQLV